MPIKPYLSGQAFDPETVSAMSLAFARVCEELRLTTRSDSERLLVAGKIIELTQCGVRDPDNLAELALHEFRHPAE